MILVNQLATHPLIPKTIFIKRCRVEIKSTKCCVFFHRDSFLNLCGLFCQQFSAAYLLKLFLHNVLILLSLSGVTKPEITRWCLCSLHAGIQMSPDEVVGSRDGCRHSIAEGTVFVPIRLLRQIFSARTALFSRPFA